MAVPEIRLSGGSSNTSPAGSLGGIMSSTEMTNDTIGNLFDNISRQEALLGRTEYRCVYIYNDGPEVLTGVVLEILTNPTFTIISAGLDPAGKGDGSTTGVGTSIVTEDSTPSGVTFFGESGGDNEMSHVSLPIGILNAGEAVPVWFKRVTEQGPQSTLSLVLKFRHDTPTMPGSNVDDGFAIGELISVVKTAGPFLIGTAKIGASEIG